MREPFLADWAAEGLLSAVSAEVGGQVSGLGERLAARVAAVWFLAAVGAHVRLESGGSGVALPAYLTDVATGFA